MVGVATVSDSNIALSLNLVGKTTKAKPKALDIVVESELVESKDDAQEASHEFSPYQKATKNQTR
ncbi:MAG: hypothetical protein M2R45_02528 [Verrucomicrobia subdivision 3 bacterium]|nr:hypothetical protein [Limisphaerales bacterium]MCS1414264.1 hypothetical protein [Limisphaerales bacterium]